MAVDPFVTTRRENLPRRGTPMPPSKPWLPDRPGDHVGAGQPQGGAFGYQGPDQGYALRLAEMMQGEVTLAPGEHHEEVVYGVALAASRRASVFGRAPIGADVEIGYLVWGFLPDGVPSDVIERLVALRRPLFADVAHDGAVQRVVVEAVPADVLELPLDEVRRRLQAGEVLVRVPEGR